MHVDYLIVDPTPFVNQVFIQLNAFVNLVTLEIHELLVTNVSWSWSDILHTSVIENLIQNKILFLILTMMHVFL